MSDDTPRFVTAVSKTGSRIHAVETPTDQVKVRALCGVPVERSGRQEFIPAEMGTNCWLCCTRSQRKLRAEREGG